MKFLTITSCTGEKASSPGNQLVLEDFVRGGAHLSKREKELKAFALPAGAIYTGQQHVRLMRGIEAVKGDDAPTVDLHILSAGYGMIPADRSVVPYECTFATMKSKELRQWADRLGVPEGFRETVKAPYDLGLILLGDNYLEACALDATVDFGGPTLLFCGTGMAKKLPALKQVRVVPVANPEAKRFSCGLVALKGDLAARVLRGVMAEPEVLARLLDPDFDLLGWLEGQAGAGKESAGGAPGPEKAAKKTAKSGPPAAKKPAMRVNPMVDQVIEIPKSWWEKPHRKKLRYFIPEWDDLVDPDYDFLTDTHSGGRSNWANEVYAHQMYPEPNYDGLLMSRAVAEKSQGKKERINAMGVHRMLRVPREFPIMGDCGAFDYIMEDVPPYSTEDVLDYYTRLDFDYGVSVDHLIVTATEHQKKERYELTINNAADFLKEHRKAGLGWEAIGAVQGWDPKSYAAAAGKYVQMGYKYLGLGGLVRSPIPITLSIVEAVRAVIPSDVEIHLFGIARLAEAQNLSRLGVNSVDSASPMRRAWLGAKDNYRTLSGNAYRAIRIPGFGKSFRSKRMISEGRATEQDAYRLEQEALRMIRGFDSGRFKLEDVLEVVHEYDQLIGEDRPGMLEDYRRTLEAAPWRDCPCSICRKDGVEVIIFRGNNRNRRRGFHNTFVFHQMLQGVLTGMIEPPVKSKVDVGIQPELGLEF